METTTAVNTAPPSSERAKRIYKVTLLGSIVNVMLLIVKFTAGITGNSAAMMADAIHSFSDFATDLVVIAFVRLSSRPADTDHNYGHGKYETIASSIIGMGLLFVAFGIAYDGVEKIVAWYHGEKQAAPHIIALVVAVVSVVSKEWLFRITKNVAKAVDSPALESNAWHHRSDAFSSVGTTLGIGGAILLGNGWGVLDAVAAIVVSVLLFLSALRLLRHASGELLEESLPKEIIERIKSIAYEDPMVKEIHNFKTRRIGRASAIEMHLCLPGTLTLEEAYRRAHTIKHAIWKEFGRETYIIIQVEPYRFEDNAL